MAAYVRRAAVTDQAAIEALVSGERLNPNGIEWPGFRVATHGDVVVGAVQLRRHRDGSRELGSLVVSWEYRGRGIASMLIDNLLADQVGPVHLVTARSEAFRYARWGFRSIAPASAPRAVRRNFWLGQVLGGAVSLLSFRAPRRLVILKRL
jgi:N-acetylglutamate synthase-like GNAT family acetyltransferase